MSKLTGQDLEYFVTHYEKYKSAYKTQIYFCFDSKATGKEAFTMLRRVYAAECNYNAYGADYRDFYLGFTSQKVRDAVLADIEQALASYQATHGTGGASDPNKDKGKDDKKLLGDTSVYLIAGAVVAVVMALLLNRKKKK